MAPPKNESKDYFTQMPAELIDLICDHISDKETQNLRLCCNALEKKSRHSFIRHHFKYVRVMNTRDSLQHLIDLTKVAEIRNAIKGIDIIPIAFNSASLALIDGEPHTDDQIREIEHFMEAGQSASPRGFINHVTMYNLRHFLGRLDKRDLRRERRRFHARQMHDQNLMRRSGTDVAMLTQALQSLHNIKHIHVICSYFITPLARGSRELVLALGGEQCTGRHAAVLSHVAAVVLGAIARSSCQLQLERLYFLEVPKGLLVADNIGSSRKKRSSTPASTFSISQFADMKLPRLKILGWSVRCHMDARDQTSEMRFRWFQPFIGPTLRDLIINDYLYDDLGDMNRLNSAISMHRPQLRSLHLFEMRCDFDELHSLLQTQVDSLQELSCTTLWVGTRYVMQDVRRMLLGMPHLAFAHICIGSDPNYADVWSYDEKMVIDEDTPDDFRKKLVAAMKEA
ncbi:hypothetical protein IQ07DRAFT_643436 [Pyrenochaeta sp. DS3sAY3a]|nr:hypothetical protein IQ07DRAFT_643436 [Pyrenochaeta sp. DS3sAY3a]